MFLAENLKTLLSASIALVWTNTEWAKPKPLIQAERENKTVYRRNVLSFSVSDVFADAKVMLCYA